MDTAEPESRQLSDEVNAALRDDSIEKVLIKDRVFRAPQHIYDLHVTKPMEIVNVRFDGGITVDFCTYEKGLHVNDVFFGGKNASFEYCTFNEFAFFRPQNLNELSLRQGTFAKGLRIQLPRVVQSDGRQSRMGINLAFAQVSGEADISTPDFNKSSYQGPVKLGPIEADNMVVEQNTRLVLQGISPSLLSLRGLVLADKASVQIKDVYPQEFWFTDVETRGAATISFDRVGLARARFEGTSLEKIALSNVVWAKREKQSCLYGEIALRDQFKAAVLTQSERDQLALAMEQVATNYRHLVLNYEAGRNYSMAEQFHFGEMEMMRFGAALAAPAMLGRARPALNTFWLYRFLSIYGTSYRRAIAVLFGILTLFTVFFLFSGLRDPKTSAAFDYDIAVPTVQTKKSPVPPAPEIVDDVIRTSAMTLSIASLQKERPMEPVGTIGAVLISFLQILAPLQAAMLLFALRRKFRRASV